MHEGSLVGLEAGRPEDAGAALVVGFRNRGHGLRRCAAGRKSDNVLEWCPPCRERERRYGQRSTCEQHDKLLLPGPTSRSALHAARARAREGNAKGVKLALFDGGAHLAHQSKVIVQVVDGIHLGPENLIGAMQVVQVGT